MGQVLCNTENKSNAVPDLFVQVLSQHDLFEPVVPTFLKDISIIFYVTWAIYFYNNEINK